MATVHVYGDSVEITFSGWERLFTWRRSYTFPLTLVSEVDVAGHPTGAVHGARSGLYMPGVVKIGRWGLFRRPRTLVSARRSVPALKVVLTEPHDGFQAVLVSMPDAEAAAERILWAVATLP